MATKKKTDREKFERTVGNLLNMPPQPKKGKKKGATKKGKPAH